MGPMLEISHRTKDGGKAYSVQIPQFGLGVFLAPADGTCKNACLWAIKAGYRHIDTAAVYRNLVTQSDVRKRNALNKKQEPETLLL